MDPRDTGRVRVLLVDDDEVLTDALSDLIRVEDSLQLVGAARDAEQGLAMARDRRPDVVLVDAKMPKGGGAHLARRLSESPECGRVVAFSAYDDRQTVLEMVAAGCAGYVVKGGSPEEVVAAIRRSLEGGAQLSAQVAGELLDELSGHLSRADAEARRRTAGVDEVEELLASGSLAVVFQPIVQMGSGRVVGAEALARVPDRPDRPIASWFALAEEVGLLAELELAAIRRAVERLPALPAGCYVTLNVSPSTMAAVELEDLLAGVPRGRVVLEMTEHAKITDYRELQLALVGHRARGIRLAVDDAGVGYASFERILELDPEIIKVDLSVVRGIDRDPRRRALTAALTAFAREVGADVVAEGVETPEELEALRSLDVPHGQGFLFARPGPPPLPEMAVPKATGEADDAAAGRRGGRMSVPDRRRRHPDDDDGGGEG